MNVLNLSAKNLKRKKIRTSLTIGGVAIAVAVLVSLAGFDRGYQKSLTGNIDKMGYQLLVTAKGCPYEAATLMLKGGGGLRYMEDDIYNKIKNDPRIDKITPQLVSTAFDPDRQEGQGGFVMYMGITDSYLELKPWSKFQNGGWFSSDTAEEVIMGYEAAEVEQRHVGDEIYIPKIDKILKVVGIFERTGTQDDGIIFMPLKTTQNIFSLDGKLTGVGLKLKDIQQIAEFEEDLYNEPGIQVISMAQVRGTILNLISSAKVMANSIGIIAVFIAVIGVVNTILMSVFERTREIGVMKAIGASKAAVFRLIWTETILVCSVGGLLGCVLAIVGSGIVEHIIKAVLPYAPEGEIVLIGPSLLLAAIAGTIITGFVAGIYPAWRASSMRPVEAIRTGE
ncbi:Macrolide export ATP-binding/permease protein MacB [Limihaloglobus sulfuriphilus]|uniref:Macrolide export ATP-binding/permease protein MacB n=1 Tax=Limihaloglobus sulfuriphilus TaxID=1851148 RepID=A0A1Q2MEW5_9BACT|nr:ABC transporter permease [Limihaloglobus sulfuriphilus]AQQ71245.1 Macrolide export ATP-binding/permease protein MacB [Limihaloglobus sulfuriphilus]